MPKTAWASRVVRMWYFTVEPLHSQCLIIPHPLEYTAPIRVASGGGVAGEAMRSMTRVELYGTSQVAEILGIPEWRVKNFSEGAAYKLPPAHRVGSGRGSRRLYGWEDIFRI